MSQSKYRVFISFPRLEREDKDEEVYTEEYYFSMWLYHTLEDLMGIHTFYCPYSLKERKEETFSLEIKRAMEECDIILCVSLDPNNEGRKYVEEERKLYIDTRNKRKPMPYFVVSSSTKSLIEKSIFYTSFDSEMALYKDTTSISTMLNTLNQVILKENKRVSDIKLCKNCFRIFHDHNEEGTICLYHPISQIKRTEKGFLFQCCNKLAEAKKNEIPEISPGCMIGKHEF